MKVTKISSYILVVFSIIVLLVLTALLVLIPYIANSPTFAMRYTDGNNAALRIYLYIADLAAIWFMVNILMIMQTVSHENAFVMRNVRALKQIAAACLVAFLDFAVMIVVHNGYQRFGLMVCTMILLFGAFCAYVLARVFEEAVGHKAENDLTI